LRLLCCYARQLPSRPYPKQFAPKPKPYIAGNIATSLRFSETGESIEVFLPLNWEDYKRRK
jgi:hypothetical protein